MTASDNSKGENEINGSNTDPADTGTTNTTLAARRKATPSHISSGQIPPLASNMDYFGTDVEYNSEHSRVEAWLDEHPEFFQAYLIRKGTRSMIDSWLVTHALPPGVSATTLHNVDEEELDELSSTDVGEENRRLLGENECPGNGNVATANSPEVGLGGSGIPIPAGTGGSGSGSKVKSLFMFERS